MGRTKNCVELRNVYLSEGLEEIREDAFFNCGSLRRIIPLSVKKINDTTFDGCSSPTSRKFCDKIEEFVSGGAMRDCWNQDVNQ